MNSILHILVGLIFGNTRSYQYNVEEAQSKKCARKRDREAARCNITCDHSTGIENPRERNIFNIIAFTKALIFHDPLVTLSDRCPRVLRGRHKLLKYSRRRECPLLRSCTPLCRCATSTWEEQNHNDSERRAQFERNCTSDNSHSHLVAGPWGIATTPSRRLCHDIHCSKHEKRTGSGQHPRAPSVSAPNHHHRNYCR